MKSSSAGLPDDLSIPAEPIFPVVGTSAIALQVQVPEEKLLISWSF
jgi:hypothetical protein